MKEKFKVLYVVIAVFVVAVTTMGATYAYWVASTKSLSNSVQTSSTIYSISMNIDPLYHDFSVIPMNDSDALKALKNGCKDKYDRGACSAYTIYVYDYNEDLQYISGYMDIMTNNMKNLSYMMLRISDTYEEDKCAKIGNENYCIVQEAAPIGEGIGLNLGSAYEVTGMSSTKFILMLWLSNLDVGQNDIDIGSYTAAVTMQAGNGGKVEGVISSAINIDDSQNQIEDEEKKEENSEG